MLRNNNYLKPFNKIDLLFIIFLFFVVLIQIFFFIKVQYHLSPNGFTTENFEMLSKNLALYNTYALGEYPDLSLYTFRPPLHPFLLSLCYKFFGTFYYSGIIFHNVLFTLSIVIIYITGRQFHPTMGFIASLLLFIDPISIKSANSCQSEIPFMFFLSLSLFWLVIFLQNHKLKHAILFSICFTSSTFIRTVTIYFPFFVILLICFGYVLYLKQNKLLYFKFLLIFLVIYSIPVSAWMYRNYKASGNSDFAGMKATHLYNFISAKVVADRSHLSRSEANKLLDKKYINEDYYKLTDGEKEKYKIKVSKQVILEHWQEFIKNYVKSYFVLFFSYPVEVYALQYEKNIYQDIMNIVREKVYTVKERVIKIKTLISQKYWGYLFYTIFIKIYYLMMMCLSFWGLYYMSFKTNKIDKKMIGLFLSILFIYLILITCTWATGRLRIQILPVMSLASAYILWSYLGTKNLVPIHLLAETKIKADLPIALP